MSNIDDFQKIGEEGGIEALSLVAGILSHSAASTGDLMNDLYEGKCAEVERWKERALRAERMLMNAEHNLVSLLYDDTPIDYGA